mmetsp:Transcript_73707/g.149098  ORF Transcript_73707/g.149098 Transcript_73707/m.149098 type:complete len:85 (-) Transcript_73707:242-496(-)
MGVVSQTLKFLFLLLGFVACGLMIWKATEHELEQAGILAIVTFASCTLSFVCGFRKDSQPYNWDSCGGSTGRQNGEIARCYGRF